MAFRRMLKQLENHGEKHILVFPRVEDDQPYETPGERRYERFFG